MIIIENCNSLSDLRQKLIDGEEVRTARQEPCEDVIRREDAINAVSEALEHVVVENEDVARKMMNKLPSVTPQLTASVLANMLMEERIKGTLDSDTTFEKDIIRDVKCKLTVSIRDHRPCYCGAELREVWREQESEE